MNTSFSCIILLVAAVLFVPGCFAEETQISADTNATETIAPAEETVSGDATAMIDVTNTTEEIQGEAESIGNATYTADANVTNLTMAVNETVLISLKENPTTGYMWNVTNSSGLVIMNDDYTMDASREGMVGVGGIHEWLVQAVEAGNQTFSGIYMRSFENITGDEENYKLDITVE